VKLERIAPALFVLLWSSGWIAPVFGSRHATAEAFLSVRFALAALAFAAFSLLAGARWPRSPIFIFHGFMSGLLLHGIYLGGVWWAIFNGVPASVSGVIAALQPLLTAALAPMLIGERLSATQVVGLVLGFAGILTALVPSFQGMEAGSVVTQVWPIAINVMAMFGAVFGTLYQKRFIIGGDMRTTAVFQYIGAFLGGVRSGALRRGTALRSFECRAVGDDGMVGVCAVDGRGGAAALHDPQGAGFARRLTDLSHAAHGGDRVLAVPRRTLGPMDDRRHGHRRVRRLAGRAQAAA
jgi:uncharacterized membrane protein